MGTAPLRTSARNMWVCQGDLDILWFPFGSLEKQTGPNKDPPHVNLEKILRGEDPKIGSFLESPAKKGSPPSKNPFGGPGGPEPRAARPRRRAGPARGAPGGTEGFI